MPQPLPLFAESHEETQRLPPAHKSTKPKKETPIRNSGLETSVAHLPFVMRCQSGPKMPKNGDEGTDFAYNLRLCGGPQRKGGGALRKIDFLCFRDFEKGTLFEEKKNTLELKSTKMQKKKQSTNNEL